MKLIKCVQTNMPTRKKENEMRCVIKKTRKWLEKSASLIID